MKRKYPDAILLFRTVATYIALDQDAIRCHDVLGTSVNVVDGMMQTSFPFAHLDAYLPKLIRAGKRLAICEQLEDPKISKELVKRGETIPTNK